jgi:hypothetical protein
MVLKNFTSMQINLLTATAHCSINRNFNKCRKIDVNCTCDVISIKKPENCQLTQKLIPHLFLSFNELGIKVSRAAGYIEKIP